VIENAICGNALIIGTLEITKINQRTVPVIEKELGG